ncbi:hypothetical protein P4O66_001205 [Electrophorus voltai]|uniref:Neuromedin-K n=2 Tax=Electrophorus TaxID=8004 RepID=A0AAD9DWT8_9TELE|nr:hypothetical protein P4O66_001205 [Electrophorus voltai]
MGASWCLALPSLLLVLLSCPGSAKPALEFLAVQGKGGALSSRDTRQYDDVDYDSFVGLMGRRSTGNLDIDDIFVGLLGRRSSDSDIPPWAGESRARFFMKNRKFR